MSTNKMGLAEANFHMYVNNVKMVLKDNVLITAKDPLDLKLEEHLYVEQRAGFTPLFVMVAAIAVVFVIAISTVVAMKGGL
jgi:hypothetical protein